MDDTGMSIILHASSKTRMSVEVLPASGKAVLRIGPYGGGLSVISGRAEMQRLRDVVDVYLAQAREEAAA